MKILFISHFYKPHVGGVEVHLRELIKDLRSKMYEITTITTREPKNLKKKETKNKTKIYRISYPDIKFLGLLKIWVELFKLKKIIKEADLVHIHDVFIWYLPFKLIFPKKKVYITFHGGQDKWPVPIKDKLMVKMAKWLTDGCIAVGEFIEKYYKIKPSFILYGGTEKLKKKRTKKQKDSIVWLGRLDKNTDLPEFLKRFRSLVYGTKRKVVFVGDGELRSECEKYGKVTGFVKNPEKYLKSVETVVPVGYLSYLEAKSRGCKIKTFPTTPIKRDYWKGIKRLKTIPTWDDVVKVYLKLWKS